MYRMLMLMSMIAALSGCPGGECKTQADCDKGEVCQAYNYASDPDDAPKRYACAVANTTEGDTVAGYKVTKIEIGTAGASVTVEPVK